MSAPHPNIGHHPKATDAVAPASGKTMLSIWFFCGALMLVYGLVLIPAGIYQMSHPPHTVLQELHPTFWWGVLLTAFGGFYTIRFRPGKG